MKIKTLFVLLMLTLHFSLTAKNQEMVDLYKYVIEDYYNESIKNGNLSEHDTFYLIWCFYDCYDDCFGYDIKFDNDKIQFKMPEVSANQPSVIVHKLNTPELEGQSILISISPYRVKYNGENKDKGIIYSETTTYIFKYNCKKSKYELKEKKEYGL